MEEKRKKNCEKETQKVVACRWLMLRNAMGCYYQKLTQAVASARVSVYIYIHGEMIEMSDRVAAASPICSSRPWEKKCWGVLLRPKQNLLPPSLLLSITSTSSFFFFFWKISRHIRHTHTYRHSLFLFINRSFVLDRKKRNRSARARTRPSLSSCVIFFQTALRSGTYLLYTIEQSSSSSSFSA